MPKLNLDTFLVYFGSFLSAGTCGVLSSVTSSLIILITKTTMGLFGGIPSVLSGPGVGGPRSSLGMPREVCLGPQGAHSGSRMSSVVVESEPILCLGRSGSSIAVESELT